MNKHELSGEENTWQRNLDRRKFVATAAATSIASLPGANLSGQAEGENAEVIGPVLGHIDENRIFTFIRAPREGEVTLVVSDESNREVARLHGTAEWQNDLCVQFAITNLKPDSIYRGSFLNDKAQPLFAGAVFSARTPDEPENTDRVVLGMGSCVSSNKFDRIWRQIAAENVEGFCLLGDTPYIDSNDLAKNRANRREFWSTLPGLIELEKTIPFWGTWDDHDFGKNDSDGLMPKKADIRKAFIEYNAMSNYGENGEGIYSKFRRGPLEVWMLDDRWFSQTEPSFADPAQKTCLGEAQWRWLKKSLAASDAPFKMLCGGMVWYPKGNSEKDHWETYAAEREALFRYIREQKIPGVILVSGDIHVCRHHNYGPDALGYPLHEYVISPMHDRIIPALDVEHPARQWSETAKNVFLKVEATRDQLVATWIDMNGTKRYVSEVGAADLKAE